MLLSVAKDAYLNLNLNTGVDSVTQGHSPKDTYITVIVQLCEILLKFIN